MIHALVIAILMAGGVYLILQRGMLRITLGLSLLSYAVNLIILVAGVPAWRSDPLMDRTLPADAADPLPQAFVLTAIVISMASTAVLLVFAALGRDDDTHTTEDPARRLTTMGRKASRIEPNQETIINKRHQEGKH